MIAFVYPGQGSDPPWVAADVLAQPHVVELVEIASDATGVDVELLLRRGGRELARTEVLQPALVALCLGVTRLLEARPAIVAGHSLGELTAWSASGAISAEAAIRVAALRGRLMAAAATAAPGGMIALRGTDACRRALTLGELAIAASNAPDEYVLSGDHSAIARVAAAIPSTRLPVAGAWHSPRMAAAAELLAAPLRAIPRAASVPIVANRDGSIADPDAMPALLASQLVRPIEWVAAQRTLARVARRWLLVGPGAALRGFARRTVPEIEIEIVDSMRSIEKVATR